MHFPFKTEVPAPAVVPTGSRFAFSDSPVTLQGPKTHLCGCYETLRVNSLEFVQKTIVCLLKGEEEVDTDLKIGI